jgi:hypothetical protein
MIIHQNDHYNGKSDMIKSLPREENRHKFPPTAILKK